LTLVASKQIFVKEFMMNVLCMRTS